VPCGEDTQHFQISNHGNVSSHAEYSWQTKVNYAFNMLVFSIKKDSIYEPSNIMFEIDQNTHLKKIILKGRLRLR